MTPAERKHSPLSHREALALYERIAELHQEKDLGKLAATFTEDIVYEDDGATELAYGYHGIERQFTSVWRAFPDFAVELTAGPYVAEGAPAFAVWGRISGTMTGPLEPPGLAPTGTEMSTDFAGFYQSDGERVSYARIVINTTELAIQLGASPASGGSGERWALRLQRFQAWRMRRRAALSP